MTEFIQMREPTDEDKKFWDFYDHVRREAERQNPMMLTTEQLEERKHENPDR